MMNSEHQHTHHGPSPLRLGAIAFDLGNVLVRVDHLRFCQRLASEAGLTPPEVFTAIFDTGLEPGYDTGRLSSSEFFHLIMERFGLALPYPTFCDWWNDIFDPLPDMEEVAARLATLYPLYLVSNTNALHFDYVRRRFPGLLALFQGLILSFEIGSRKPEPGFYQRLIERATLPPARVLFIDDKLPFVEAAQTHGLTAWHFTTAAEFQATLTRYGVW